MLNLEMYINKGLSHYHSGLFLLGPANLQSGGTLQAVGSSPASLGRETSLDQRTRPAAI